MNRRSFVASLTLISTAALSLVAADIPRPAPDLAVHMVTGSDLKLSQYRGKVVMLEFLITTCPHCKKATGIMTKLQTEYGPRGLQCIGVAINEMPKLSIPAYVTETGASNLPIGFADHNTAVDFLQHPAILRMLVPQVVFIDRKGVIRAQRGGEDPPFFENEEKVMRENIEKLLAEKIASSAPHKALPKKKGT